MKKLYQLKNTLTLDYAAQHLSVVFGEQVREADILQLCLDGHLKLSVDFVNGVVARAGKVVSVNKAKMIIYPIDKSRLTIEDSLFRITNPITLEDEIPENLKVGYLDEELYYRPRGIYINENEVLELDEESEILTNITGIYDLPMIGGERLDIEHKYQMLTDGVAVTSDFLDGAFVVNQKGDWYQLQEDLEDNRYFKSNKTKEEKLKTPLYHTSKYYPAGRLPYDSVLVIRTSELVNFELKIAESEPIDNKDFDSSIELGRREQQLEIILAVIAALGFAPLEIPDGGKAIIKSACLTRPRFFTDASFNHAWKVGISKNLIKMVNHEKYSQS